SRHNISSGKFNLDCNSAKEATKYSSSIISNSLLVTGGSGFGLSIDMFRADRIRHNKLHKEHTLTARAENKTGKSLAAGTAKPRLKIQNRQRIWQRTRAKNPKRP